MTELEKKYITGTLSSEELNTLKEQINGMSDENLANQMYEQWLNGKIDDSCVDSNRLDQLKEKINIAIGHSHYNFKRFRKTVQMAAAVLLPVFILSTFYFYKEVHRLASEEMVVATGEGERANITLPDGTNIALNSNSKLVYVPKAYHKVRQISFNGEGYFQVHKDAKRPFLIDAKGLKVKVLGTVFNLQVRSNCSTAELALEQGRVLFSSLKTNKDVVLNVGNKAILDQNTGNIKVLIEKNILNTAAWKHGFLTYHETALMEVIKNIEANYGVSIAINKNCLTDMFTGTLPSNNLKETLLILEKSYHLNCIQRGKKIVLSNAN